MSDRSNSRPEGRGYNSDARLSRIHWSAGSPYRESGQDMGWCSTVSVTLTLPGKAVEHLRQLVAAIVGVTVGFAWPEQLLSCQGWAQFPSG
ncbi:hypothetical protein LIER_41144 [Lithospermum erythrorhizon]|uniref:Uncharacterized protein n=1 Tax=Lithospermum erythrorhizon TaxID=34254 RepID=A0AAV3R4S3_LITER